MTQLEKSYFSATTSRNVVGKGPSIGSYMGSEIPAWIEAGDGTKHEYSHILAPDGFKRLAKTESVIYPGLVYKTAQ